MPCSRITLRTDIPPPLKQLIRQVDPAIVLFPHTYQVRDFAPRLATRFGQPLVSDVIANRTRANSVFARQFFQGKLNADFTPAAGNSDLCLHPGGRLPRRLNSKPDSAPIEAVHAESSTPPPFGRSPDAPFRESARAVDLTAAEIIVSVGRGIKEKDNIPVVEELAKALGAELAASRPICDNGWLPMERQVGSSGQTVAPKVYMAVGISGAIQHLVGMKGSKTIVAINKDRQRPHLRSRRLRYGRGSVRSGPRISSRDQKSPRITVTGETPRAFPSDCAAAPPFATGSSAGNTRPAGCTA